MAHRTLVVEDRHSRAHRTPAGHPDSVARVDAVHRGISRVAGIETIVGRPADRHELERVHLPDQVDHIRALSEAGGGWIDSDTFVSRGTFEAARFAAGAGLVAIEALTTDPSLGSAFVATRPPGHHATAARAMGFCIFNNVAVAAARLLGLGARVVILDWDAHHGNGTQSIFWDEDRLLYISIHQETLYPGTGHPHERGPLVGHLTTANLPLPAGATGDRYLALLDDVASPLVAHFGPDWILVSCGFDAHIDDPHAEMGLEAGDFAAFTGRVRSWAPEPGRTAFFLEGGYDLAALEESAAAVLSVLTGAEPFPVIETTGGPGATRVVQLTRLWGSG